MTTRIVRDGAQEPVDRDWLAVSPGERMAAVWTLTKLGYAWMAGDTGEPDFEELLSEFNAHGVDYLVVGAHALAAHGHVRATKDLDVWVNPSHENADKVIHALATFGAPLHDLRSDDLTRPGLIFQIGIPPLRIGVITEIDGVIFDEAWPGRFIAQFGNISVPVLSRHHLLANKRASGRLQDLADVEQLEKLGNSREKPKK
jgi:hypothetical protein